MLNLPFAMLPKRLPVVFFCLALFLMGVQTQPSDQPRLTTPLPGAALQGTIAILGTTDIPGFESADLFFSYTQSQPENWYLLAQFKTPVNNGQLALWDTTTITDGSYLLKLRVNLQGGKNVEILVNGLRVRNYTIIETNTPAPSQATRPADTPTPTPVFTPTVGPTPTAFPPNPAQLAPVDLQVGMGIAVGVVAVAFFFVFIYFIAQNSRRKY
jgi:hypothetical protein